MVHVDVLTDAAALAGLEPEWEALVRASGATPFQSPAWLLPWWEAFAPGTPFVVTLRESERLVGLAPLYRVGDRLLPIGISVSDHLDVLLHPDAPAQAGAALLGFVAEQGLPWVMEDLPPDAVALDLPARDGDSDHIVLASPCMVLDLPGPDLAAAIPAKQLRNLRNARNRAARRGLSVCEADADSLPELLEALFRLHGARWVARGEAGVLADPRVQQLHREAAPRLLRAGLLRLRAVRIEGRVAAVYYGFHHGQRAYGYVTGFDPAFAYESPGTLVVGDAIEAAWREGARAFHFLRGREAYKSAWGARPRWNLRRVVTPGEVRPARAEVGAALSLMRVLIGATDRAEAERAVAAAPAAVRGLWAQHPGAFGLVHGVLGDAEHGGVAPSPEGGVAAWADFFDRAVRTSPEGSVALYSIGDAGLLRAATEEVVGRLRDWGLVAPGRDVLDLGCGIGRIAAALAEEVGSVTGVDVSREMLAEARRRCAGWPNVRFVHGSGLDLEGLADGAFDLMLAVDSFPYLVQAGMSVAERHFYEARRVLRAGGALVVLQLSYRGDPALDRADVQRLADASGLVVLRAGLPAFAGWDALAFHLARAA
jgi:CelD/BcsL family acetyltransferase involved in cellulose biosynthesis/SAM-dependent methyltransferase